MNKEPLSLYIFRFILGFALLFFMGMLYWSSLLIENNVMEIRRDLSTVKDDLTRLKAKIGKGTVQTLSAPDRASVPSKAASESGGRNILLPDTFYETTLPEMLGADFKPHGTFKDATAFKLQNLHPFSGWYDVMNIVERCAVATAKLKFGYYEKLSAFGAERIEEKINPETKLTEYWVYLRKDIFWEPLQQRFFGDSFELNGHFLKAHPLTAYDYKLWFDAFMNVNVSELGAVGLRTLYNDLDRIDVIDDYTFVVRWKGKEFVEPDGSKVMKIKYNSKQLTGGIRPLAGFVYKYFADGSKILEEDSDPDIYRKSSVWAQNFSQHWAKNVVPSCGPWKFDGMTDQRVVLKRNNNFPEPYSCLMDTLELSIKTSQDAVWQEFKAGNLTSYTLQPEKVAEFERFKESPVYADQAAKNFGINTLVYLFRSFTYVGWNNTKPLFRSPKVRRALTMAIDRNRIIKQNLNNLAVPIHGPFFIGSTESDPNIQPLPFDPKAARKLLEAEGWYDSDGDGIIDKEIDGKRVPFSFKLVYYVKNPVTKSVVEYISTALKEVGIDCRLDGIDLADLTAKLDDRSFDAYYLAWTLGTPPSDPRQIWHSSGAAIKGSSNTVSFANPEVDKLIDRLDFESNPEKRTEIYHTIDRIISDEQPYTFLFTHKYHLLYREPLQNVFLPVDRQDILPGATVDEPQSQIFWLKE